MTEATKATRLSKAAREFNVGIHTIVEYLAKKGIEVEEGQAITVEFRVGPEEKK